MHPTHTISEFLKQNDDTFSDIPYTKQHDSHTFCNVNISSNSKIKFTIRSI